MSVIEVSGLSKYYGTRRGIVDLDFQVNEGEIFGFIGPNGAGKTTTMNILLNFIYPTKGEAKIFGLPVSKETEQIKAQLGFVASEDYLYVNETALSNLNFAAKLKGVKDAKQQIKSYAEALDLDLKIKVKALSKGNKRKVSLISALLGQPKLLILDEISAGLDPLIKARMFEILKQFQSENGFSVFFSSHILSEIETLCERTAFIKEGLITKLEYVKNLGQTVFKLKPKTESFSRLMNFLSTHDTVLNLRKTNDEISFTAESSVDICVLMEKEQLFQVLETIQIKRSSLEETFMADYET